MCSSIALQLFDAYYENLQAAGFDSDVPDAIPCPLCLRPITRDQVISREVSLEHIIPQHSTRERKQATPHTRISVKNVRSGLTLLCRECNEWKGSRLDSPLRGRIVPGERCRKDYSFETGTAILTYAYLLAFAVWGYEYIHERGMDEIRDQFLHPDERRTPWLEHAQVSVPHDEAPPVCNQWGYPFIRGSLLSGGPMELLFWRFRALLPSASGVRTTVNIPESIIRLAHETRRA